MRTQIYWRAVENRAAGAVAAIELLVSVQTSLLDSCPKLQTHSTVVADSVFRVESNGADRYTEVALDGRTDGVERASAAGYVFRLAGSELSYAEMAHPADARLARFESRPQGASWRIQIAHELFAERLEKGVILRGRALGLLLNRGDDLRAASAQFAAFLAAEPPLTT
jgi:hypothetical protein